jgi:hypothetical protein
VAVAAAWRWSWRQRSGGAATAVAAFLGYASTDQNILYLDLDSVLVKRSHHAQFDEAWYLQPTRPPAAQLLYNLGLEADNNSHITVGTTDSADDNHI